MNSPQSNPDDRLHQFTRLWMASQPVVASFIRLQVRDHHHTEDLLQDVARDATAHFDRYDPDRPFTAWVLGIARQRVAGFYRGQKGRKVVFCSEVVDAVAQAYGRLDPQVDDRVAAMRMCIERLSSRHRNIIQQRYGQMLAPEEIAQKVGAHRNAVNVMLHRIRKALADCIRHRMGAQS